MKKLNLFLALTLTASLFSCSTDDESSIPTPNHIPARVGFYVLSEGTMNKNDSKLSLYNDNTEKITYDYFEKNNNGTKIGDTATDIVAYGGKTYIIVNNSHKVIVMNSYTGSAIDEVEIESPRYGIGTNGKLYVTSWKGEVAVIDTTALTIKKKIALSEAFSEGIAEYKGNLYIANSGKAGDSFGGAGTTISVVSLATESETSTITVPQNPNRLAFSKNGELYVSTWGDWSKVDAQLHKVDLTTKKVTTIEGLPASRFALSDKYAYTYHFSYITYAMSILKLNLETMEVTTVMDNKRMKEVGLRSIYDIAVDSKNNDVYYLDESGVVVTLNSDDTIEKKYKNLGTRVNTIEFLYL